MRAVALNRYVIFLSLAVGGCAVDLWSKRWIFDRLGMPHIKPSEWLIERVFGFTTSLNEGALFGVGPGQVVLFSTLSIIAALGILYWLFIAQAARDLLLTIAFGCVMAGILGNLYDRLGLPGLTWLGDPIHLAGSPVYAVRDWLDFKLINWPIFNIADSLLVCGAGLLIWHSLRSGSYAEASEKPSPATAKSD